MIQTRSSSKQLTERAEAKNNMEEINSINLENPSNSKEMPFGQELGASLDEMPERSMYPGKETGTRPKEILKVGAGDLGPRYSSRDDMLRVVRDEVAKQVSHSMGEVASNIQHDMQINSQIMQDNVLQLLQRIESNADRHGEQIGQVPNFTSNSNYGSRSRPRQRIRNSGERRINSNSQSSSERTVNGDLTSFSQSSSYRNRVSKRQIRLPPFTGKENWEVWLNRFNDVANIRQWNNHEKLGEILPLMQGSAGEFVFGQLSQRCRSNLSELIDELTSRFKPVESRKTYSAQFSHRNQKPGENVESFAAELKRLYDKAYPDRDRQTRKEDLLRRFLDGLSNDKARFHVEFTKDPPNIDQAIIEVVNFIETNHRIRDNDNDRRKSRPTRAVHNYMSDLEGGSDTEGSEADRIARNANKPKTNVKAQAKESETVANSETKSEILKEIKELKIEFQSLKERVTKVEDTSNQTRRYPNRSGNRFSNDRGQTRQGNNRNINCFRCGQEGHYARSCSITGQLQLTTQNSPNPQTENSSQTDPN